MGMQRLREAESQEERLASATGDSWEGEWDEWTYWWMCYAPDAYALTPMEAEWMRQFWSTVWKKLLSSLEWLREQFLQRLATRRRFSADIPRGEEGGREAPTICQHLWERPVIHWQGRKEA